MHSYVNHKNLKKALLTNYLSKMKKGLLSLLAVALTVVSCQNYDDQFDELSDQITALSGTVQGLSSVADQITALTSTVNGLATAASVSGLQGDITTIKAAVDALTADLADVATAADLATISSTLGDVKADVKELLAANAVINQNIVINNVATLEYVESLISTDADDPNVIVNGTITVAYDDTPFTSATHLARITAVTDKFATSLKTVTISNTYSPTGDVLSFANLAFVDNDLSIDGATNLADGDASNDKLRTVTGDLAITNIKGDIDLSLLTSAGDIVIPGGAGVTALKMGSVTAESLSTAGEAKGHLNLVSATIVDGGKSSVSSLVANVATDVDFTAAATVTVNAPKAATIDITGASLTGDLSITASSATVVKLPAVTSVGGTITTGNLAELHLPKLSSTATMSTGAKVMDLSALASQKAGSGPITNARILNFNAPKLDTSGVVSIVAATDITIKDHSAGSSIYALAAKNLTVSALAKGNSVTFNTAATIFPALVNLNVTGVAATAGPFITTQTNAVSVTSGVLTTLSTAGTINAVNLHGAAKLTSLTTAGFIRNFSLIGAALIETADLGHDHIEGSDAATFRISDAAKLTTIAPSALDEVGTVMVTALPKLTSLNLGSMVTLPILGSYTITISETGLTGSFGIASEATTTTQAYSEKIYSDDLMTLKPLMTLAAASAVVTYVFAGDIISSVSTRTFDANGVPSAVSATGTKPLLGADSSTANILAAFKNAASKVTTPVNELDFTYVAAE